MIIFPFSVHSHNDFLLAILTRCQILVSTPGKGVEILPGTSVSKATEHRALVSFNRHICCEKRKWSLNGSEENLYYAGAAVS